MALAPGTRLGPYEVLSALGAGGMGEVYLGEDTKLGRKAAIKVLSKGLAGKEDFVARFYQEARAMARVNHDNAVSVYDVDQDRSIHYVAMEFVDGMSMQKWMDTLGILSVGDALHVALRCAEALQFAHSQNLVHRDIKPDNIMLTSKGKVKVADFGLANVLLQQLRAQGTLYRLLFGRSGHGGQHALRGCGGEIVGMNGHGFDYNSQVLSL